MADRRISLIITAMDKTQATFKSLRNEFKRLSSDADNFKLRMKGIEASIQSLVGAVSLYKLGSILKDSIDAAEQMQNALRGLAAVSRYAGEDVGQSLDAATKLAEDGLVDVQSAAQSLQNLLSRGFSLRESIEIIERLKDSAAFNRQAHLSMSEAVKSATEGLKNENSILVDNAGVTKNVSIMWKEYAASIGKSVNDLTQAEKRQAEYNGILRETEGQMGNAKLAADGLTGSKARLTVEILKLKVALGESLTPAFNLLGSVILWVIDKIKSFLGGIEITGARLSLWLQKIITLINWLRSGRKGGFEALKKEFAELNNIFEEQSKEIVEKFEGKIKAPDIGKDTGKRRQDINVTKESIKKLGEEWSRVKRDLETDIAKVGVDEFEQKILTIENKAADLKEKFGKIPGAVAEITKWLARMKEQIEWKKREEWEKKYTALFEELQTSSADEYKNRIQKSINEEAKKTKELVEIWTSGVISYEEYQRMLTEIEEKYARERAKIEEDYNTQILEAESRRRLAMLDMAEKEMSMSKEAIARRRLDEYRKLLEYYEKIRQKAIELRDIQSQLSAEAKIDEIRIKINELNLSLQELTGSFSEGFSRGLTEYIYNLKTTFQLAKDIATQTAQAMQQAFSDFFFDAFEGKLKSLSDYLKSFLTSVKRALANALGQYVTHGIVSGVTSLFSGFSAANNLMSQSTQSYFRVNPALVPVQHTGGYPHEARQFRLLPRFHSGIGPDEVLSIIRKDEAVFTPGQMKALGMIINRTADVDVQINIENKTGFAVQQKTVRTEFDGKRMVKNIILELIQSDKTMRDILGVKGI